MSFSYAKALTNSLNKTPTKTQTVIKAPNAPTKAPIKAAPTKAPVTFAKCLEQYFGVIEPVCETYKPVPAFRGACWGDVDAYDEKEDGPLNEYLDASAKKRTKYVPPTEQELEEERQRFKDEVERKERLREQAREQAREKETLCKCGCGQKAHINPRPDFAGYCCNWCKKYNGTRGHGEACGKTIA
jgi:hypothetical protein